jgi:hypothetical protein
MNAEGLAAKLLAILEKVGGWRTIAEAIVTRVLFLLLYLVTGQVVLCALAAAGWVLLLAAIRFRTEREKWWQAAIPLAVVGLSALLAGGTGHATDFYLPELLPDLILGPVCLVSMLIRTPVIGLLVEGVRGKRGERFAWRRDRPGLRLYQRCTAVFLIKFTVASAVMIPLYVAGNVIALGIATTVLTTPALAGCIYLCWRMVRTQQPAATTTGAAPDQGVPARPGPGQT